MEAEGVWGVSLGFLASPGPRREAAALSPHCGPGSLSRPSSHSGLRPTPLLLTQGRAVPTEGHAVPQDGPSDSSQHRSPPLLGCLLPPAPLGLGAHLNQALLPVLSSSELCRECPSHTALLQPSTDQVTAILVPLTQQPQLPPTAPGWAASELGLLPLSHSQSS